MTAALLDGTAQAIAAAIGTGDVSAREIAQATLDRIEARNGALGAFTDMTATRALAKADAIDTARARRESLGPLAGAPFAVKNMILVSQSQGDSGNRGWIAAYLSTTRSPTPLMKASLPQARHHIQI